MGIAFQCSMMPHRNCQEMMDRISPTRQAERYVQDYSEGRLSTPIFKPKLLDVDTTPYPNLIRDPVRKLAKAQEDYSILCFEKMKPKEPEEDIAASFRKSWKKTIESISFPYYPI